MYVIPLVSYKREKKELLCDHQTEWNGSSLKRELSRGTAKRIHYLFVFYSPPRQIYTAEVLLGRFCFHNISIYIYALQVLARNKKKMREMETIHFAFTFISEDLWLNIMI